MLEVTVRGIILDDNNVILMFRRKNNKEYYAIPGGHIEENETKEECLIREIKEEYSIDVEIVKYLGVVKKGNKIDYIYKCKWTNGSLKLGGEEKERNSEENYYEIRRVTFADLNNIDLFKENLDMIKKAIDN